MPTGIASVNAVPDVNVNDPLPVETHWIQIPVAAS
jgi:hypothetical protein